MSLTTDRRVQLLGTVALFDGIGPDDLAAIAEPDDRGRLPGRSDDRPPGRGRHRLLPHRDRPRPGRPRRRDDRPARAERLLRRAVAARRRAADRDRHQRGSDDLPGDRVVGVRELLEAQPRLAIAILEGRGHAPHEMSAKSTATDRRPGNAAQLTEDRSGLSGTVTFLFTDIEGSSRLEQERRHRGLCRAPGAAPGDPPSGVRGARRRRAGHRGRLVLRDLPERRRGGPGRRRRPARARPPRTGRTARLVRVRMGLHTGEVTRSGGRLRRHRRQPGGPDRGGRPRRPGPRLGGDARTRRRRRCRRGAAGATCGEHRLKDFPDRSGCASSSSTGSRPTSRPLADARRPPEQPADPDHHLRRPRPRAGRGAGRLLDTARLLTLTGPGGTGKTRLALELADRGRGRSSPTARSSCPFEPVDDPILVPGTIARAVGIVEERRTRPPLELLERAARRASRSCSSSTTSSS